MRHACNYDIIDAGNNCWSIKPGQDHLDLITDRGPRTILVRGIERHFTWQGDGFALLTDVAGNCFHLPPPITLDAASRKRLEEIL